MPSSSPAATPDIGRAWFVRLRWGVAAGQLATLAFAGYALALPMPVPAGLGLIGITALSNVALGRIDHPSGVPAAVVLDLVVLTALLAMTGGASNPFSVLYLLHVALAAVLLGPGWTSAVTVLAVLGFGLQFPFTDPHAMHRGAGVMQSHLWGMWLAFAATGAGISWFVARLAAALRVREAELARLRRHAETQERVVALATLAAGAAHELGSPLAAVAVAAREIELLAEPDSEIAEEARAQRAQVERCREIVARLTQRAGAGLAEPTVELAVGQLWSRLAADLRSPDAARTDFLPPPDGLRVRALARALAEATGSLLRNALQAGPGRVRLEALDEGGAIVLAVTDAGEGMPPAVRDRAGEPFFTTRPAGEGMGLGLFLARGFAESLGGSLTLRSVPGEGTVARLSLPGAAA